MMETILMNQQPKPGPAPKQLPGSCTTCGILIFNNRAEAGRIQYQPTVNRAIGSLCIGCAGGDESLEQLLIMVQRIEHGLDPLPKEAQMPRPKLLKESVMQAKSNGLYLEMETGVMPPTTAGSRGYFKWLPLEEEIMKLRVGGGRSEWIRFRMHSDRDATNASAWLKKREEEVYSKKGHGLIRRVVKNGDGTAWLYIQRIDLTVQQP